MGQRVRWSRALVAVSALGGIALVACGLSTSATGGLDAADGSPAPSSTSGDDDSGNMLGADAAGDAAQQVDCTGLTMCTDGCTDLHADPDNCGMCGMHCDPGDTCTTGACALLCVDEKQNCSGACVDLTTDPNNCGTCGTPCTGGDICSNGKCGKTCNSPQMPCPADGGPLAYCANLATDTSNCGVCGKVCDATQVCTKGACGSLCAPGVTVGEQFGTTMQGCLGTVNWKDRAGQCAPGMVVCSPEQWVARRGAAVPAYNYWTNANLARFGYGNDNCEALETGGFSCTESYGYGGGWGYGGYDSGPPLDEPMHVCGASVDKLGNRCAWVGCGLNNATNASFGGCTGKGNDTAGTLCCTPD